jgi:predicted ArsR family transcriptional regulator
VEDLTDLLSDSQKKLIRLVQRFEPISVFDAAERSGLAETTVRQHFDALENKNLVSPKKIVEGRGRPKLRYSLSQRGRQLFPTQDGKILSNLLRFLGEEGCHTELDTFIRRYWDKREQQLRERLEQVDGSLRERMNVLESFLEDEGFLPEVRIEEDGTVEIKECNCPMPQVVSVTKLPCRLEARFLEKIVERGLDRVTYMPEGYATCTYTFDSE